MSKNDIMDFEKGLWPIESCGRKVIMMSKNIKDF